MSHTSEQQLSADLDPTAPGRPARRTIRRNTAVTLVVLASLVVGALLHAFGLSAAGNAVWAVAVAVVLLPLTWSVIKALRAGQLGVDLIALLAMAGALAAGEYLAGVVIALMMSGGSALEEFAQGRASRELSKLVERAPREAHVRRGEELIEVRAADVVEGDLVVIRAGEIVPVDGIVQSATASLDTSALTGEPLPVTVSLGDRAMSGSANVGNSFELRALTTAEKSMYASIVLLVEQAMARKAPMVRMADRYSVVFLVVTLAISIGSWIITGDPIRALAVLVIATPCPLILSPPVALVGGTSRAARRGIIVKGSAAIERLGRTAAVLIDKTGTITAGTPGVADVIALPGHDAADVLALAGAVEQMSVHSLAEAIAHAAAAAADGALIIPTEIEEQPGSGISGRVGDRLVAVGSSGYLRSLGIDIHDSAGSADDDGIAVAHVAINGERAGYIHLADTIRADAPALSQQLRALGLEHVVMATGDHADAGRRVADAVGIENVIADCTPQQKLDALQTLKDAVGDRAVVMVGDGVNDAPALAAADVGIAMGSAGATAASESAEAVIINDRVSLVASAIVIGRRSRRIALQSIIVGMTLSMIGMGVAAAGYLPPVYGALSQEVIDLVVILNALRAMREPWRGDGTAPVAEHSRAG